MIASMHHTVAILRDGRAVVIRAQRPSDEEGLLAALARSSDASVRLRFFGPRRTFSEKEIERFINIDFHSHVALVGSVEEAGVETLIGGGRYVRIDETCAKIAFAVVDAYQGLAPGSLLLRQLATIARAAELREF